MGDRVSISFVDYNDNGTVFDESVALFDHYAGQRLVERASKFIKEGGVVSDEACFVVVEFILSCGSDFDGYLGKDARSGDNSDNGHFRINIKDGSVKKYTPSDAKDEENALKQQNSVLRATLSHVTQQIATMKREIETELRRCE